MEVSTAGADACGLDAETKRHFMMGIVPVSTAPDRSASQKRLGFEAEVGIERLKRPFRNKNARKTRPAHGFAINCRIEDQGRRVGACDGTSPGIVLKEESQVSHLQGNDIRNHC